jgi:2-oxoglutarate dehydrogenase E1 component
MTPKSLLRLPEAVSGLDDCVNGSFQRILPDGSNKQGAQVRRILLCTGKIFYELDAHRKETSREDVVIVRLEQLYPLRSDALERVLSAYQEDMSVFWVQEEPENMGAWRFLRAQFGEKLFGRFPFTGIYRPESASPATGSHRQHKQEQAEIIARSFGEK